ncbi:retrovirus-related pol polyprotein from transposon TNT 1-94 [Tanacetum coccineum]|uniref:Retrovirus-related pol polyprotein from transposon TNT 1-94 n=1 Tax=Tanacetum coccineum TaxID=301880 RepID=A0ABQ5HTR2_9ASTR
MNMALVLMAKAFKLNYSTPTNNNQRISSNPHNRQIAQPGMNMGQDRQMRMVGANVVQDAVGVQNVGNQNGQIVVPGITNQNPNRNGNVVAAWAEGNATGNNDGMLLYLQTQLLNAQTEEAGIPPPTEEFEFGGCCHADLDEIEEIFNMSTQEEQYTKLLEPIPEPHQVQQNDSNVISVKSPECGNKREGTVDQHPATVEETPSAQLLDKVSELKDTTKGTSVNTKFANQSTSGTKLYPVTLFPKSKILPKVGETNDFSKPVTSNSVPTPTESHVMKNDKVISPGIFRINPFKNSKEEKCVPNKHIKASVRARPITVSQPHLVTKKDVNSDSNGFSSTGVNNSAKTIRPQPRSNTKIDRVPSASKSSCIKNQEVEVEEHHRNLPLFMKKKHMSSECNNFKLVIRNAKYEVVCAMCTDIPKITRKPSKTGKLGHENQKSTKRSQRIKAEARKVKPQSNAVKSNSGCSKHMIGNLKLLINFAWKFLGTVRFGNDHVAAIMVYDLEVAFRRNTCFVRNIEGVDMLKGNRTTNLYTINLHEMASASLICLMARATSTKSWLWHQRLSHLNFDTINDLAKNNLVTGLPKFKYHKEHLCPSCEQGKSKRVSHTPKRVPNSKQRLHLLHIDLCGPMRVESINDEAPEENKTFLKKITVLLQALTIIVRTDNGIEFKNQVIQEYFNSVGISHQASSVRTHQQNRVVEQRNRTLVEAARTMLIFFRALLFLWAEAISIACYTQNGSIIHRRFDKTSYELINGRKLDISFLHVFGALCYPKNDHEDIGKLGAKGDIGFFIGYFANSRLDLTYAPSTITTQQPTKCELDLLFEAMYDDYIGGQPSAAPRTVPAAQAPQVLQTPTTSTTIADTAPTPTNSSSQATNFPNTSQDVDELET